MERCYRLSEMGTSCCAFTHDDAPCPECCINHITLEDHNILDNIVFWDEDSGWLMNTGVGYLIRLDAVTNPLHRLKKWVFREPHVHSSFAQFVRPMSA